MYTPPDQAQKTEVTISYTGSEVTNRYQLAMYSSSFTL